MQPPDVFYAIVCDSPDAGGPKKVCYPHNRTFEKFVHIPTKNLMHTLEFADFIMKLADSGDLVGSTPTIFKSFAEAEEGLEHMKSLQKRPVFKGYQFWLKTFRLTESSWNTHITDDDSCRELDARRLASGMLHYNTVCQQLKKLAGKVLTILDASYVNDNQNKAVKDLTKNSFRSQLSELYQKAHESPDCQGTDSQVCMKDILE